MTTTATLLAAVESAHDQRHRAIDSVARAREYLIAERSTADTADAFDRGDWSEVRIALEAAGEDAWWPELRALVLEIDPGADI